VPVLKGTHDGFLQRINVIILFRQDVVPRKSISNVGRDAICYVVRAHSFTCRYCSRMVPTRSFRA
jgi:hypothetical protein